MVEFEMIRRAALTSFMDFGQGFVLGVWEIVVLVRDMRRG